MSSSASGGWRFSSDRWESVEADATTSKPAGLGRTLRLATLNCLHDNDDSQSELLQHEVRYDAICRELAALDADVIGLNEVTRTLLQRLLREEWVRSSYTVSAVPDDERCSQVSTVLEGALGNLLLSKIPPVSVKYIDMPSRNAHSHMMSLCVDPQDGAEPLSIAVCSTHLTAFPWLMESRRKRQLEHVTSSCIAGSGTGGAFDLCVVMGDLNFHREAENASIPNEWVEVPAVVAAGETWDFERNAMLAHYLPLRNIYNGFGLGASLGWSSRMRLDRVLVHAADGAALDSGAAKARIFADQPIHERARDRAPLPQLGRELREAHRSLPWEEYLFPSDHFGIFVELPLSLTSR